MALLTATPNPIGVYGSGQGSATIHYDTEAGFNGIVYYSVNGIDKGKLGGPQDRGARRGDLTLILKLGDLCRLSLRRVDNDAEIMSLMVGTYDVRQQLAEGFSQAYFPELRPQMITSLIVTPGVDTVRVSFRTTRATIPTIGLFDANGAYLDGRMPLFGGLQTKHGAEFGIDRPLALGSNHKIVIEAFGATGNPASPNKATRTIEFISGSRSADVVFESVNVHDDGDSGTSGAGEFVFSFGVGDRATGDMIGSPVAWPDTGVAVISDDDPPVDIGISLPIAVAPRTIWAQVIATDDDTTTGPLDDDVRFHLRPKFEEEGSRYFQLAAADHASITVSFDLGMDAGRFTIPFDMATGDFPLDYVMSGHVFVRANEGEVISTKMGKLRPSRRPTGFLTEPGEVVRVAGTGAEGHGHLLAMGADGAIHLLSLNAERRENQKTLSRIELPSAGTVALSASADGLLDLVALDGKGGVLYRNHDPRKPAAGKWRRLGGALREVHPVPTAVEGKKGGLLLAGIGRDGSLQVMDPAAGSGRWDKLGDERVQALATIVGAVIAMGEDGKLIYVERRRGRWWTQSLDTRVPGDAATQLLAAAILDQFNPKSGEPGRDLLVAAMGKDLRVWALRWLDYPRGSLDEWVDMGPVQDLWAPAAPKRASPAKVGRAKTPKRALRS